MNSTNNYVLRCENNQFICTPLENKKHIYNLEKNTELNLVFIIFNNVLDLDVNVMGEGINGSIKCLYLAKENDKIDINIRVSHLKGNNQISQEIKGIATGESQVHFKGLIDIKSGAMPVKSTQHHRGLLLSDNACIKAVPELAIYADDVVCAHGSAVGPLSKEALFYLMARGIGEKMASQMLIHAFIGDFMPESHMYLINDWVKEYV